MKERAVAIVVQNHHVLLIHRRKDGEEYHTLPGGGVEAGETPEQACLRELQEEVGIDASISLLCCTMVNNGRTEHYFGIRDFTGEPTLGGPEALRNSPNNSYALVWVHVESLQQVNLKPSGISTTIVAYALKSSDSSSTAGVPIPTSRD